ncbi:hypothetical protein KBC04_05690 [Candidatus Babeliales bacterium]|nr:hypothetical protein [Candidatus Babeliales bacterium]MBP9844223.1 hypothetical protein [Candidatus Babeliales bacterium]
MNALQLLISIVAGFVKNDLQQPMKPIPQVLHPCVEYENLTLAKKAGYHGISTQQEIDFESKRQDERKQCLKSCIVQPAQQECSRIM